MLYHTIIRLSIVIFELSLSHAPEAEHESGEVDEPSSLTVPPDPGAEKTGALHNAPES